MIQISRFVIPFAPRRFKNELFVIRSGFKTFNQVQSQGGARDSTAGIYLIFRVLNPSVQHRNWA
jgi:hypothetical protein